MPREVTGEADDASVQPRRRRPTAVRLVRQLRKELGTEHGTVKRVADQLGYGVESVRGWVKPGRHRRGVKPGRSAEAEADQGARAGEPELRRANAILKSASAFFAAELDRPQK
jgi:transposase